MIHTSHTSKSLAPASNPAAPSKARWFASASVCLFLLAPAVACQSDSANPLIGTWTLSQDGTGPKVCGVAQKVKFTAKSSETWNDKGLSGGPQMITYVLELPNVFIPGPGGAVSYTVSGDSIIWHSPYGPCTYTRA